MLVLLAGGVLAAEAAQVGSFSCEDKHGKAPVTNASDEHERDPIIQGMSFMQLDMVVSNDDADLLSSHGASEVDMTLKSVTAMEGALKLLLQQTGHTVMEKLQSHASFGTAHIIILVVVIIAIPALTVLCFAFLLTKIRARNPNGEESQQFVKHNVPPMGIQASSSRSARPSMPFHQGRQSSSETSVPTAPHLGMRPIRYSEPISDTSDPKLRLSNASSVLGASALWAQMQKEGYGNHSEPFNWPSSEASLRAPVSGIKPLCDFFFMPHHEARFMVPVQSIQTWHQVGGCLGIMGSFQYPLLYASISKGSDGRFLEMSTTPDWKSPVASIGPLDNTGPLRVMGQDDQLYGLFAPSSRGYELRRDGQPDLQALLYDPSKSDAKVVELRVATGENFASVELSPLSGKSSDAVLVVSCHPGSDGVLVALTSLACIYLNPKLLTV